MNHDFPRLPVLLTSLFLTVTGLGGLAVIIINTVPTLGPRWRFYFFLFLSISGLSMPATDFLNRRFPSRPRAGANVIVRQSVWVGVYGCILAWLQFGRILNSGLVLFLATGIIAIELLIRMNERSRYELTVHDEN